MAHDHPPVSIRLIAHNAADCLDFYAKAFGATEIMRWVDPDNGKIGHSEFVINGHHFSMADGYKVMEDMGIKSPKLLGGTSAMIVLAVDDLEGAQARALEHGAQSLAPVEDAPGGGRRCRIGDPAGHVWILSGD